MTKIDTQKENASNLESFARLKKAFPGTYKESANAFGDSPSSPGRLAVVFPIKVKMSEVDQFCQDNNITLADTTVGSAYGHHRLIIDVTHEANINRGKKKLGCKP